MKKTIVLFISLLLFTGCKHTISAMNHVAPKEYYKLTGYDDLPQTLADKNATFSCKNMIYSSMGYTKVCYVEKTTLENIGSWAKNLSLLGLFAIGETVHMGINKKDPKPQQSLYTPPKDTLLFP